MARNMDLTKCATPEDAITVLRNAAQRFYEDAGELQSAWMDKKAGKCWAMLARDLERVADKASKYLVP